MVLIFVGGVFLLQNTGYLPPNAWVNIWRLWPLLLVIGGLELLFAGRVPSVILAALALIVVMVGLMVLTPGLPVAVPGNTALSRTYDTETQGANQANVTVRFGAGQLTVGPLVGGSPSVLASMRYDGPASSAPEPR